MVTDSKAVTPVPSFAVATTVTVPTALAVANH